MNRRRSPLPVASKRVAIYTRQSVDRSTDAEFGSLDAQREAIAAFVKSQAGEGWMALPERYDDGGFSGATIDRPAFNRLMADVRAGKVDIVATYKIDRLSRSLLDFASVMRTFEDHGVTFVSVTQQFNSTTPMGALTLNILMSFAQFEREVIAERTRDKIAAMRQRGIWCGGHPLLGYTNEGGRLIVVEDEARQVREIFDLYMRLGSLSAVIVELERRGWRNKTHTTRAGRFVRGRTHDKNSLNRILRSPLYVGRVPYRDQVFPGQHAAIIDEKIWSAVQHHLDSNRGRGSSKQRNKHGALLRGLLHCAECGARMINHFAVKNERRYHYYKCPSHNTGSTRKCPGASVPTAAIEEFVVERIKEIARNPSVVAETLLAVRAENERKKPELIAEANRIAISLRKLDDERRNLLRILSTSADAAPSLAERLGEVDAEAETLSRRDDEVRAEIVAVDMSVIDEDEVRRALIDFEPVWSQLLHRERARILALLIERIRFDGAAGEIEIKFRDCGIKTLAQEASA